MQINHRATCAIVAAFALAACTHDDNGPAVTAPPGAPESPRTEVLKAGAALLQRNAPLQGMDVYVVGFHPMKDAPEQQMEAHHFCRQVNEDFAQCALFDGGGAAANLTGIEYIVSVRVFAGLPDGEHDYWHPHNGEILSGQLVAPGLPEVAERALMASKINSYGKTWHTWHPHGDAGADGAMPLGPARLAWSFNRDGELDPALLAARDARLDIDTAALRAARQPLTATARPQSGVDALAPRFPQATPMPGVTDADAPPATGLPR